jgi:uncharacterized membrane protein (UPF0136 family)
MSPHHLQAAIVLAYAVAVGTLGMYGWVKSKDVASIVVGEMAFVLCALAAGGLYYRNGWGFFIALGSALGVSAVFLIRLVRTKTFFPAGLISALSLVVAGTLGVLRFA